MIGYFQNRLFIDCFQNVSVLLSPLITYDSSNHLCRRLLESIPQKWFLF